MTNKRKPEPIFADTRPVKKPKNLECIRIFPPVDLFLETAQRKRTPGTSVRQRKIRAFRHMRKFLV
jgi:hypothetical protein